MHLQVSVIVLGNRRLAGGGQRSWPNWTIIPLGPPGARGNGMIVNTYGSVPHSLQKKGTSKIQPHATIKQNGFLALPNELNIPKMCALCRFDRWSQKTWVSKLSQQDSRLVEILR